MVDGIETIDIDFCRDRFLGCFELGAWAFLVYMLMECVEDSALEDFLFSEEFNSIFDDIFFWCVEMVAGSCSKKETDNLVLVLE